MKRLLFIILIILISPTIACAEMQMWVDKNGVKHFSNTGAPQDTEFETSGEIKYDKEKAEYYKAVSDEKEYQKNQEEAHQAHIEHEEKLIKQEYTRKKEEKQEEFEQKMARDRKARNSINRQIYPTDSDSIYWRYNTRVTESQEDDCKDPQSQYPPIKIDPHTGTTYTSTGDGNYINTKTGALNVNHGGGQYFDIQTGKFKRIE